VTELTSESADLEGLEEGYQLWLASRGGVWTISLAEMIDVIEKRYARDSSAHGTLK